MTALSVTLGFAFFMAFLAILCLAFSAFDQYKDGSNVVEVFNKEIKNVENDLGFC